MSETGVNLRELLHNDDCRQLYREDQMQPICYDNYYWQNDLVRLRAVMPEDWERGYRNLFDSEARRLLQCDIELPPVPAKVQESNQKWVGFDPAPAG